MIQNHAKHRGLFDIPNHRSSHDEPTPTGGGWAFALVGLVSGCGVVLFYQLSFEILWLILLPMTVISISGGIDDMRPLSPQARLIVQTICSAAVGTGLYKANPNLEITPFLWLIGGIGAVTFLIWFINLYNFMDGIDGIAGLKAITVVLSWVLVRICSQEPLTAPELIIVSLFIGSVTGFLFRNWSPASIFMGDVGSGYIGCSLATAYLYLVIKQPHLLIAYFIPCSVFWVDATFTLLRRIATGQKYLSAHRSHAYQILSRKWRSHSKVVIAMGLYNLLWLLPLSILAASYPPASVLLLAAWLPLTVLAWYVKAGLVND